MKEPTTTNQAVQYVLPPDLVVAVKKRAADEGRRYSDVAADALRLYLARPEPARRKRASATA